MSSQRSVLDAPRNLLHSRTSCAPLTALSARAHGPLHGSFNVLLSWNDLSGPLLTISSCAVSKTAAFLSSSMSALLAVFLGRCPEHSLLGIATCCPGCLTPLALARCSAFAFGLPRSNALVCSETSLLSTRREQPVGRFPTRARARSPQWPSSGRSCGSVVAVVFVGSRPRGSFERGRSPTHQAQGPVCFGTPRQDYNRRTAPTFVTGAGPLFAAI